MKISATKKQILKYTLLPQIFPRFKDLVSSGFSNLAYFMALVYRATLILPNNHPYLRKDSIGKYSIRNVLAEAANNLVFDLKHIDQIIIFFALIAGLFILVIQFFFLLLMIFINPASAGPFSFPGVSGFGDFFKTPTPADDLALRMLDSVFGVPIFGSKEATATVSTYHQALHSLYQLYSFGLLVVAVIILIYFIFAIIAETAQTGTPFGKRYNHVWTPIRLVVGIGLLVPMTYGINASQWITLYAAKYGSGFATTGWSIFNATMANTPADRTSLIARPNAPKVTDAMAFLYLAHACKYGYEQKSQIGRAATAGNPAIPNIDMYIINDKDAGGQALPISSTSYEDAVNLAKNGDIVIRVGQKSPEHTAKYGGVFPHCGDLILENNEPITTSSSGPSYTGSQYINLQYYYMIRDFWINDIAGSSGVGMTTSAKKFMERRINNGTDPDPDYNYKAEWEKIGSDMVSAVYTLAISQQLDIDFPVGQTPGTLYSKYGWGGASLWYNKIANANGKLIDAASKKPQIRAMPFVMTFTCDKNKQQNNNTSPNDCYDPNLSDKKKVQFISPIDATIAKGLSEAFKYWYKDPKDKNNNVIIDVINALLGTQGLFDMCKNADIHPLAQLSALGKGMIDAAVRNLAFSFGSGAAGILGGYFGPILNAASSFFGTVASTGILIGFILYYIIPFLPFLYFMFAMGGWVKGIFEAMVGVPLWALAHLRIDGEGLPGDAGINGYFLIFEIFIRPILIIFGLLASFLIFSAMVKVLNDIFTLVVSNLSGFSADNSTSPACGSDNRQLGNPQTLQWARGPIDELFFTILYAIVVYMIGLSSFKLIDQIPNHILRWMGQGVSTFNDQAGEPAEGLLQKVAVGGSILSQQVSGAVEGAKGAAASTAAALAKAAK